MWGQDPTVSPLIGGSGRILQRPRAVAARSLRWLVTARFVASASGSGGRVCGARPRPA